MATFVEMMACAFVPAPAVVGGKSAAVGAHAPQVLRAPQPDENAAAEGKPPRRHLLDSQHVEDAGRVMSSTGRFSPVYPCPRECLRGVRCAPSRGAPSELLGGLLPAPKKARAKMPLAVCVGPRWRSSAAVSCITSLWANSEAPQTSKAVHYPPCRTSYIGGVTICSEPRKFVEELQRRNASTGDGTAAPALRRRWPNSPPVFDQNRMQHAGASSETLPCPNPSKRNHPPAQLHRRNSSGRRAKCSNRFSGGSKWP